MPIDRREALLAGGGFSFALLTGGASAADTSRPILWQVERGGAKVTILGFSEAKDRSWLTPAIQKAFESSREIWFETPQRDPSAPSPPPPAPSPAPAQPPGYSDRSLFFGPETRPMRPHRFWQNNRY